MPGFSPPQSLRGKPNIPPHLTGFFHPLISRHIWFNCVRVDVGACSWQTAENEVKVCFKSVDKKARDWIGAESVEVLVGEIRHLYVCVFAVDV